MTNAAKKKAVASRVINKASLIDGDYSTGYKRSHFLPKNILKSFNLACFLKGLELNEVRPSLNLLLESMTEDEFRIWIIANA